ncbi:PRE-MRNA CLEAVAGE FACTOR IM 25 KDA SUBUNIT 1 [Salix viminalis]|uniref:Pre-mRNA cleavage factor Im 25 kDa subunit n=1 Tax=Salix viminalis TaxID=40686 RepID=A0A9Q0ZQ18_SALVM|nr:PRE-MRNA CLEAVAGE FACTOR IM 25 KDA SUBUNIT 1 [Salix viminalis]
MGDHTVTVTDNNNHQSSVIQIYPLGSYYFGSKDPIFFRDETVADRVQRMKSNFDARGLRTCVQAVMLVELFQSSPYIAVASESDIDGLKRKLSRMLSVNEDETDHWEVGDCLGMWWKSDFETLLYPYPPPNRKVPKECTKLYLVKLPVSRKFIVPKNLKLLAVPLCQVHENHKTYGPVIPGVPQLLSKFSLNINH